jgi:outer membrane immunogenic protein
MRFKVTSVMAAAIAFGAAQTASAADMPLKARPMIVAQTWTGCFIGANVGAAWERTKVVDEVSGAPIASLSTTDAVGGGQIGCDYQFAGNWVIGVQGMLDASGIEADTSSVVGLGGFTLHGSIPWFATVTGRLGYAVQPNLLLYGRGGGAWTHTDAKVFVTGTSTVADTGKFDQSGWTAGGGAELKFAPNWSVFAEYNYVGLTDKVVTLASGFNVGKVHQDIQTATVGVNFRFGMH